jgi:hypothetical protein
VCDRSADAKHDEATPFLKIRNDHFTTAQRGGGIVLETTQRECDGSTIPVGPQSYPCTIIVAPDSTACLPKQSRLSNIA